MTTNEVMQRLLALQEQKYGDFMAALIPNIKRDSVIGVRAAGLQKIAKDLLKYNQADDFLRHLPHRYLEENLLHAILIGKSKDYDTLIKRIDIFLPFVDNWAVNDTLISRGRLLKLVEHNLTDLHKRIKVWLKSSHPYTIRFAVGMLMNFFLDENSFNYKDFELVTQIKHNDYYVKMMIAWYLATALCKQYHPTIKFLQSQKLDADILKKTIQKAVESRRLSKTAKQFIRQLQQKTPQ